MDGTFSSRLGGGRGRGRGRGRGFSTTNSSIGFPPIRLESIPLNEASAEIFADNQRGMEDLYGPIPGVELEPDANSAPLDAEDDDDADGHLQLLDSREDAVDVADIAQQFLESTSAARKRARERTTAAAENEDSETDAPPPAKRVAVDGNPAAPAAAAAAAAANPVSDIHHCIICELEQLKSDDHDLLTLYNFVDECAFRGCHPVTVANYAVSYFNLVLQERDDLRKRYNAQSWQRIVNHLNGDHAGKDIHLMNARIHDLRLFLEELRNKALSKTVPEPAAASAPDAVPPRERNMDSDTVRMYLVVTNTLMKMLALRTQIVTKRDEQIARARAAKGLAEAEEQAGLIEMSTRAKSKQANSKKKATALRGFIRASVGPVK